MKRLKFERVLAMALVISMTTSMIGCTTNTQAPVANEETSANEQTTNIENTEEETEADVSTENETDMETEELITEESDVSTEMQEETSNTEEANISNEKQEDVVKEKNNTVQEETLFSEMTEEEKNSYAMLSYLTTIVEEIRTSKNSRLLLEDIYYALENNLDPEAIDVTTQEHLQTIRDVIKSFRQIAIKRERLEYLYNQQKAEAVQSAIPKSLTFLSIVQSTNWKKLATSVVYTIVDSYNNYNYASKSAEQQFLLSGWELDDEEDATLFRVRDRAFDYMVNMSRGKSWKGKDTLSMADIETFAEICEIDSLQEKINRLEAKEDKYKYLGNYWLELAECYYDKGRERDCLSCIEKYKELSIDIHRIDRDYAKILPKAIVAAKNKYRGEYRISKMTEFADALAANITDDEWALRYFVSLTYLDLYAETNDSAYLDKAFAEVSENVDNLLGKQRELNNKYLNDVQKVEAKQPNTKYMNEKEKKAAEKEFKNEQKQAKEYNKALENARKTELPPLYEPLIMNYDLLHVIAEQKNISDRQKREIDDVLKNNVFLSKPILDRYSFFESNEKYSIVYNGDNMIIPVNLLTADAEISVSVITNQKTKTFNDFKIKEVKRNGKKVETFEAYVSGEDIKDYQWTKDSKVTVKISNGEGYAPVVFKFKVSEFEDRLLQSV